MVSTRTHILRYDLMVLLACATPVLDANVAPMDTDDTALTLTSRPAHNMPGSLHILPSSGSFEQTSGTDYYWEGISLTLCIDRWSRHHDCLQPTFNPLSS